MGRREIIEFYANDTDSLTGDENENAVEKTVAESSENLRSVLSEQEEPEEHIMPESGYDPIEDADDGVNVEISSRDSGNDREGGDNSAGDDAGVKKTEAPAASSKASSKKPAGKSAGKSAEKSGKNKKNKNSKGEACETRICSVGGEALMEGIMMRSPYGYAQVVRTPDGSLSIDKKRQAQFGSENKFLGLPIVRGSVRLADSLIVGTKALFNSAEISVTEDDPNYKPSKFDLWVEKHLGDKAMNVIMTFSLVLALAISIGLFFILPQLIVTGIKAIPGVNLPNIAKSAIEGVVRLLIFLGYLAAISSMKDIRRVFMYHGAEHKTIHCYEHFEELTVENVRKYSKHHPRCGTAFLFVVMMISILVHALIPDLGNVWLNILTRLASLPIIAGIAYEFNRYAGSHENKFVKILRAPGLFMQRFTTREPDDDMIEVAIVALNEALSLENAPDYSARDTYAEMLADKARREAENKTDAVETDSNEPSPETVPENHDSIENEVEEAVRETAGIISEPVEALRSVKNFDDDFEFDFQIPVAEESGDEATEASEEAEESEDGSGNEA
jgi:uncharacterized protein YqhQ